MRPTKKLVRTRLFSIVLFSELKSIGITSVHSSHEQGQKLQGSIRKIIESDLNDSVRFCQSQFQVDDHTGRSLLKDTSAGEEDVFGPSALHSRSQHYRREFYSSPYNRQ